MPSFLCHRALDGGLTMHKVSLSRCFLNMFTITSEKICEYVSQHTISALEETHELVAQRCTQATKNAVHVVFLRLILDLLELGPNMSDLFFEEFAPAYVARTKGVTEAWNDCAQKTAQGLGLLFSRFRWLCCSWRMGSKHAL